MAIATILLQRNNFSIQKATTQVNIDVSSLKECENAIKSGQYIEGYDLDQNGELTWEDYDELYDILFGRYDTLTATEAPILLMIGIKRMLSGTAQYNAMYDIDGDGEITVQDYNISRGWAMYGKLNACSDRTA